VDHPVAPVGPPPSSLGLGHRATPPDWRFMPCISQLTSSAARLDSTQQTCLPTRCRKSPRHPCEAQPHRCYPDTANGSDDNQCHLLTAKRSAATTPPRVTCASRQACANLCAHQARVRALPASHSAAETNRPQRCARSSYPSSACAPPPCAVRPRAPPRNKIHAPAYPIRKHRARTAVVGT